VRERRHDIDWLRVIATLAVFLMHCTRFFDTMYWHLKDTTRSDAATMIVAWFALWEMPLFFLLSGAASWYALRSRSGGRYLLERAKRLLIPFYTVGIFIIVPPQVYIDRGGRVANIWKLIPSYYPGNSLAISLRLPTLTNFWQAHLWFLQFLFNVSLVSLPVLLLLRSEPARRLVERLAGWCNRRGGILLFLIPLILVRIGLRSSFAGEHTWADFVEYVVIFLIGYLIQADRRFTESIRRHGWVCLVLGIVGFVGAAYIFTEFRYNPMAGEVFSQTYVLFHILWSVASWGWIVFILSLGAKHLNFDHKVLTYANEAVLPFYVLHQTIILLVGWYVIPLDIPILLKYLLISVSSFVLILAIYQLLIKWINPMRFLFGMRLRAGRIFVRKERREAI
jgi:glucan biosynthesis protein C